MNLTKREQKILWTKARNRCSYRFENIVCEQPLCINDQGTEVVVGEECHIVGEKPGAARFIADFQELESYSNAILMCSPHHKLIDDKETRNKYTIKVLKEMKLTHEKAVENLRLEIKDSEFSIDINGADRAVGMEVDTPAVLSNVSSKITAKNVREVVGFSTNQGFSSMVMSCSSCGKIFHAACTGIRPTTINCAHCGYLNKLKVE